MTEEKHNGQEPDWAKLLDLLESDPSHTETLTKDQKLQFEELRTLMNDTSEALDIYARLDVDQGWSNLRHIAQERGLVHLPETALADNSSAKRLWLRVLVAASLLCVLALGGYYFYQYANKDTKTIATVENDIQPGGNKATLVLSDGQSIPLRNDQDGITVGENGIRYADGSSLSDIDKVTYATLDVPRAGQYQLTLSDGTKVWLNADSKLTYPTTFIGDQRLVKLQGEAYFEVKHNAAKPFLVQCGDHTVKVLGTSFNVQSYADLAQSRITLVEGSVQLHNQGGLSQVLKPNEQAIVSKDNMSIRQVNAQQYVVWKDGIIVLDKQDIQSIIPQLERWYDVEFNRSGIPDQTPTLSGEIPRDISLSTVLAALGDQLKLKFEIKGRRVMVRD